MDARTNFTKFGHISGRNGSYLDALGGPYRRFSLVCCERSPGSPTIPVIVIVIVPELEFDEVELAEAVATIVGCLSLLAGSADPGEEPPPKNRNIAKTEAKHRNLTARLNVPSSHLRQGPLNRPDLFSQKNSFPKYSHPLRRRPPSSRLEHH